MTEYADWDSPEQEEADYKFLSRHGVFDHTGRYEPRRCDIEECCGVEARIKDLTKTTVMTRLVWLCDGIPIPNSDYVFDREDFFQLIDDLATGVGRIFDEQRLDEQLKESS